MKTICYLVHQYLVMMEFIGDWCKSAIGRNRRSVQATRTTVTNAQQTLTEAVSKSVTTQNRQSEAPIPKSVVHSKGWLTLSARATRIVSPSQSLDLMHRKSAAELRIILIITTNSLYMIIDPNWTCSQRAATERVLAITVLGFSTILRPPCY